MKVQPFQKVCVIGSGVMGSGIAAHLANARIPVLLLDIVPPKYTEADQKAGIPEDSRAFRDRFSAGALQKALKTKPAPFFTQADAKLVEVGNLEDDLERVKECDWVIEVIIEKLEPKQALFEKLEGLIGENTVVSSNTSGLKIEDMLQGRSESFAKRFLVTHFFNPVRYMHLLELVDGPQTDPAVSARVAAFGERVLGKGIVYGKDTPNFVANRIGVFGMMETMRVMAEGGYSVEEVDAVFGPASGRPKSAVFNTADLVGLDTFLHVAQNCWENLKEDERHDVFQAPAFLQQMVEKGWLGRKSGQGFYKKEGKDLLALDITSMEYRTKEKVRYDSLGAIRNMETLEDKLQHLAGADDRAAELFWKVSAATSIYAANRLGEIADDIVQIDNGMKWGFAWEMGPFETWDAVGVASSVARMKAEGMSVPAWVEEMLAAGRSSFYEWGEAGQRTYWDPHTKEAVLLDEGEEVKTFVALKKDATNVVKDSFATSLIDLGDGVLACEFHTKMNAIDGEVMADINEAIDMCEAGKFDALVLANDGPNFSVGANLFLLYMGAQQGEWDSIEQMVKNFQDVCVRLKYSRIPTVAAPFQMTLGGGAEVSLWCNRIRAHGELYMGLVEVGVGLLPGGGGNIEMLARTLEGAIDDASFPTERLIQRALETVAMAKVATSAEEARDMGFLAAADGVTMNRRHLLESAKQEALGMARAGFTPPRRREYRLPGKSALATFEMALSSMRDGHFISDHDLKIALKVGEVMTGGDTSARQKVREQHLLDLEREAFLSLCGEEKTMARIAYMLEKNKPLRN